MTDLIAAVVNDMDEAEYHRHPALSSSGARKLLPPSCPAAFKWERDNPPEGKAVFDFGSAAHKLVLGDGPDIEIVDAADWRTKAAREQRDAARADGLIPVLTHEYAQVRAMADTLTDHPVAAQLFREGQPEVSLFWRDDRSDVECRARLDWVTTNVMGEPVVVDYKTCRSADPAALERSVVSYGYHVQAHWYVEGAAATGVAEDPGFLFVCQEKTAPYPVTVLALDFRARRLGASLAHQARTVYAECLATDTWPGHADDIVTASLPPWHEPEEAA